MPHHDETIPLDRIRSYRVQMDRQKTAGSIYKVSVFLIEVSTIAAIVGRGLKYISRELGYDEPRRIRFPMD